MDSKNTVLKIELEDKRQIIAQLRSLLDDQKARAKAAETAAALIWEKKMAKMKEDGDKVCERSMKMCDRLMQDKAQLTSKCNQLAEDFQALQRQYDTRVEEMQQEATKEMARQKNNFTAQEKMRREQWEKDRTKEIKEMTIKGLEPEVEKILSDRKIERRRMEEQHQDMMENLRLELQQLTATKVRETKEMCHLQQEECVEKEREKSRQKLQDERERFDRALAEERKKCALDLHQQETLAQQQQIAAQQYVAEQNKAVLRDTEAQCEGRIKALKQRIAEEGVNHEEELRKLRAQLESHKEEVEVSFENRVEAEKEKIEAVLRLQFTSERDAQLESVVDKLGREAFEKERVLQQKIEEKTEVLKKEQKKELREQQDLLRQREKDAREAKKEKEAILSQKSFLEGEMQRLKEEKQTVETNLANERASHSVREEEMRSMKASIIASIQAKDQAFAETQKQERDALIKAKGQIENDRAEHAKALEALKHEEKMTLERAEEKLTKSLSIKNDQIEKLKEQLAGAEVQVEEFKFLLQRQREELLGKIAMEGGG